MTTDTQTPATRPTPQRILRRRRKGWTGPPGSVYVGLPTRWGNPIGLELAYECGIAFDFDDAHEAIAATYRAWLGGELADVLLDDYGRAYNRRAVLASLGQLRGHDLMCWCRPGRACHADVLLELANAESAADRRTRHDVFVARRARQRQLQSQRIAQRLRLIHLGRRW